MTQDSHLSSSVALPATSQQTTRGRSTSRDPASRILGPPSVIGSHASSTSDPPSLTANSQPQNSSHAPSASQTSVPTARSRSTSRSRAPSVSSPPSLPTTNPQFGLRSQGQSISRPTLPGTNSRRNSRARSLTISPSDSNFHPLEPPKFEIAKKISPGWFCVGINPGNKEFTTGKISSVYFWRRDYSENMGGAAWRIKHNTAAVTAPIKNLLLVPQPTHTPLGVSTSGAKLALLVLSRNYIPFGTPGKAKILQEKKDVIEQALRTAVEATNTERLPAAEQWLFFLRRALLLLVKGQAIQTHDTEGIYNLEPLYREIEVLIDNLETKGNHLQHAENSW